MMHSETWDLEGERPREPLSVEGAFLSMACPKSYLWTDYAQSTLPARGDARPPEMESKREVTT